MLESLQKHQKAFIQSQDPNLSPRTLITKEHHISLLLEYLEKSGINDFEFCTPEDVYSFIISLDYASQTISGIQFAIRDFFNYLNSTGVTPMDGRAIFPVIFTNKRDRILSFYQDDEIRDLINSIDISSPNGVRDKCMVLLAAQTGLRSGDIIGLKFNEILWDKHIILKTQSKTRFPVSVPLPDNLECLLIDYIKNYRPESNEDYVFISPKTGKKFLDTALYQVVSNYFRKSEVNIGNRKHGPHALRHSLASSLLRDNTPMPVITGILGHKNLNTTSKYLSIDIESLRNCCLEVPNEN